MALKLYKDLEQGTKQWLQVRSGVITGTSVASVKWAPSVQNTLIRKLSAWIRGIGAPNVKNFAMQRGNDLEDICQMEYERRTGYEVTNIGFATRTGYWGHSPDGIIYNENGKITRAIEIKCPQGETILKYLEKDKIPTEYYWQVTNYFCIFPDLEELDFLVFYPYDTTLDKYQEKINKASKPGLTVRWDVYDMPLDLLKYKTGSTLEDEIFIWTVTREELQDDIALIEDNMKEFRRKWKEYEATHKVAVKKRWLSNNTNDKSK